MRSYLLPRAKKRIFREGLISLRIHTSIPNLSVVLEVADLDGLLNEPKGTGPEPQNVSASCGLNLQNLTKRVIQKGTSNNHKYKK